MTAAVRGVRTEPARVPLAHAFAHPDMLFFTPPANRFLTEYRRHMATMANPAFTDSAPQGKRRAQRRNLPLFVQGRTALGEHANLQIYNISESGVLIESSVAIADGDRIQLDLPHAGLIGARVVWTSGLLFGCQFDVPISPATLSAAQLQSAVGPHFDLGAAELSSDHFGARLQRMRVRKGLSQSDIALHLGVSAPSISGWEKGRTRPKNARLDALAELLGVSLSELLDEPEPEDIRELIDRSREQIARAMGTTADKVRITVEL